MDWSLGESLIFHEFLGNICNSQRQKNRLRNYIYSNPHKNQKQHPKGSEASPCRPQKASHGAGGAFTPSGKPAARGTRGGGRRGSVGPAQGSRSPRGGEGGAGNTETPPRGSARPLSRRLCLPASHLNKHAGGLSRCQPSGQP